MPIVWAFISFCRETLNFGSFFEEYLKILDVAFASATESPVLELSPLKVYYLLKGSVTRLFLILLLRVLGAKRVTGAGETSWLSAKERAP